MSKIGTLQESSLHAALKNWIARPGDQPEVDVDGYWVDLHCGDHLVEIQTRSFSAMKKKLNYLLDIYPVEVVYPVAREKWVIRLDDDLTTNISRRKSPRHGAWHDIFFELISFPELIQHPNFSLRVVLTAQEELLCREEAGPANGRRASWRRKGWRIYDRRLVEVIDQRSFYRPSDFVALIPPALRPAFTAIDLSKTLPATRPLSRRMVYCLRKMGLIEIVDRKKQGYIYSVVTQEG
jgi:hypothetical protein